MTFSVRTTGYVSGLGEAKISQLINARSTESFTDLAAFFQRTRLPRRLVENLILVGAMDEWNTPRRKLIWELGQFSDLPGGLNLKFSDEGVNLDSMSTAETMAAEREILGLLADNHVISLYRDWMTRQGILGSQKLSSRRDGEMVRVAGQNVMHHRQRKASTSSHLKTTMGS